MSKSRHCHELLAHDTFPKMYVRKQYGENKSKIFSYLQLMMQVNSCGLGCTNS